MTPQNSDRFRLGHTIALAGVVFVISVAILCMTLLAAGLAPEIFPTLFHQVGASDSFIPV